jgi:hypothetical protein
MEAQVGIDSICQGTTIKGTRCKNKVANAEPYCWHHAKDFRNGWRSLTKNATILFVFGTVGFLSAVFYLGSIVYSTIYPAESPKLEPPAPGLVKQDAYSVAWDSAVIDGDHRTPIATTWLRQSGKNGQTILIPAHLTMHLTIVNQQSVPVLIKQYSIKMKTDHERFSPLIKLRVQGIPLYMGYDLHKLSEVTDTTTFLDNILAGKTLKAHATVRGWTFLEYPKDDGERFLSEIEVSVSDYSGGRLQVPLFRRYMTACRPKDGICRHQPI